MIGVALLGAALLVAAEEDVTGLPEKLFTEANRLFDSARSENELRRAAENYQAILDRGIKSGKLYYNLGSTHLRLRDWGRAILSLKRALLHRPEDPFAMATLAHARKQVPDEFPDESKGKALKALFFWHHETSFRGRLWTALLAHAAFWILLLLRLFVGIPFHRTLLGVVLVLALAAGGSLGMELLAETGEPAVIVLPEVEVRNGNGIGFGLVFAEPVHSGVEVMVLEERGNWKHLEFPNGVRGWVLGSTVEVVRGGAPETP